eukprot:Skav228281  [mRNA]  locus=scaffold1313:58286:62880:- [translate_table: standard]
MGTEASPKVRRFDKGDQFTPLFFQIPESEHAKDVISFPNLLRHWCQDWSMKTALTSPSTSLFVHIDRFIDTEHGNFKSQAAIVDCDRVTFPIFSALSRHADGRLGSNSWIFDYILVGALIHRGDVHGGHYQTLLRVGPYHPHRPGKWMLTDDNKSMCAVQDWNLDLARSTTMLSFVRIDLLSVPMPDRVNDLLAGGGDSSSLRSGRLVEKEHGGDKQPSLGYGWAIR